MKCKVVFADEKLKDAFEILKVSRTEDMSLHKWLNRAFDDISENTPLLKCFFGKAFFLKERFFITFVIIYAIFSNTLKRGPRECAIGDTRQKCWIVEIQHGFLLQQPLWC